MGRDAVFYKVPHFDDSWLTSNARCRLALHRDNRPRRRGDVGPSSDDAGPTSPRRLARGGAHGGRTAKLSSIIAHIKDGGRDSLHRGLASSKGFLIRAGERIKEVWVGRADRGLIATGLSYRGRDTHLAEPRKKSRENKSGWLENSQETVLINRLLFSAIQTLSPINNLCSTATVS